ncbi:MAG: hypothetical protein NUV96_01575 [Candidatus Colwellbacteria bacterium]|nr:hypothetical protein [Candidatus Colwellbacteria bacterium]
MEFSIQDILEIAVNAPSGHNCQPWKFLVRDGILYIWNVPEKDKTLFNYNQRGSLTAQGALIENIAIAASRNGYKSEIELFPQNDDPDLVARVKFTSSTEKYFYEYLFPYITKRTTNRRIYKLSHLTENDRLEIEKHIELETQAQDTIVIVSDKKSIYEAAQLFSVGDRVLFDNFYLHKALFSVVNWTISEEKSRREGLFVGTKELPLPIRMIFKHLISNWNLMSKLSVLDLPSKMAKKRESLYNHSSAIGVVVAAGNSASDFVNTGRVLQRLWLKVTSLGISFQPISIGLLYLGQQLQKEQPEEITNEQRSYVVNAYNGIMDLFRLGNKTPTFSFRIGYSEPPTASSLKKPPEIVSA